MGPTTSNNLIIFSKPIPLLICPYCMENIPKLLLKPSKNQMNIMIECSCLNDSKVENINLFLTGLCNFPKEVGQCLKHWNKADKYCIKCSMWLCHECIAYHAVFTNDHVLSDRKIKIECIKHSKPFTHNCKQCDVNICAECQVNHHDHQLITLFFTEYEESKINVFNDVRNHNKELTRSLIDRIDHQIQRLNKLKENIQFTYNTNEAINDNFQLLFQSLCKTVIAFKTFPSYELMKLQTIVINNKEYVDEKLNIEEEYIKLKRHLQRNYVLKQIETDHFISTLIGHINWVKCLILLKDGKLASGSEDKTIRLWNTKSNECVGVFIGHGSCVNCLIELKDGKLASGSSDNTIKLWNLTTNKCVATLTGHSSWVKCLIQLKDGRVVSGSSDKTIKLWNVRTNNECITTLTGHSHYVSCIVQLNNGRLASGSYDRIIKLWNTTTNNQFIIEMTGHSDYVYCLIQLNDQRLASCSYDNTIKIWKTTTHDCIATLTGHTRSITSLIQLTNGRLASGSYDSTIKLWSETTYDNCMTKFTGHNSCVYCMVQLNDGRLAYCSYDNVIKIWYI